MRPLKKGHIKRRRRYLMLNKMVRTKKDLLMVRNVLMLTFKRMGISRLIRQFPVRFGKDKEFISKTSEAFYNRKEIVVRRNTTALEIFKNLGHEYGHEIPITGGWGLKSNILTETTANSFHNILLKKFNQLQGTTLKLQPSMPFFKGIKKTFSHTIGAYFMFIPLGKYFKSKYQTGGVK